MGSACGAEGAGVGVVCAQAGAAEKRTARMVATTRVFIINERHEDVRGFPVRLASTVMLVRQRSDGRIEVLMVRRSSRSAFAPDAYVFPGGTVDESDYQGSVTWDDSRIENEFRVRESPYLPVTVPPVDRTTALALVRAAIRELREEASVEVAGDGIHLFSRWITPPSEPRRYDTHFFVAPAEETHHGAADRVETHDEKWIAPHDALEANARGELHLVYPTIKHLERLAKFSSVDALLDFARAKPIVAIMPDKTPGEGFVMPPELEGRW